METCGNPVEAGAWRSKKQTLISDNIIADTVLEPGKKNKRDKRE